MEEALYGPRRSVRLQGFDYADPGIYFVTACTYRMRLLFGVVKNGSVHLSKVGRIVAACWQAIPAHFAGVELDDFVVMPNHIHGILIFHKCATLPKAPQPEFWKRSITEKFSRPRSRTLSTVIRLFKSSVTSRICNFAASKNHAVWHRGFYEHIVSPGKSLDAARAYVLQNPARWELDHLNPSSGFLASN